MQHLEVGYQDVMSMPTNERRFFLGMILKNKHRDEEAMENARQNSSKSKGGKNTRITGEALKNKMKSGELPI